MPRVPSIQLTVSTNPEILCFFSTKLTSAVFKYTRTACKYGGKNIAFRVNEGSTNFWLSLLVEFEDGQGDIGSMQIKQANSVEWLDMKHVWGATWCLVRGPLVGPFSVRLTTLSAQKALTARDVIPRNWKPTATYTSRLNFEAAL
jgi:hypothetical protein